jgi:hypothetical protein
MALWDPASARDLELRSFDTRSPNDSHTDCLRYADRNGHADSYSDSHPHTDGASSFVWWTACDVHSAGRE